MGNIGSSGGAHGGRRRRSSGVNGSDGPVPVHALPPHPPPTYQQQQQQFSVAPPPPHTHLQERTRNHCVHGGDAVPATVSRAERASSVLPVSRLLRTSAAGHLFPIARPFRPPPPRRRRRHPTAPRPSCAAPQLGRWAANSKDLRWDGGGTNLIANSPMISEPILVNKNQVGANVELKKEAFTSLNSDENVILPRDPERQGTTVSNVSDDPERAMEEPWRNKLQ